jgi:glutathione S-transferase
MLKLFYAPRTCALASHIALEEVAAEYETVLIDFRTDRQRSPDYLAINPKGRVPSLVTTRGILTETPAILAYIAQTFPDVGLAPLDDPFAFLPRFRRSTATCAPRCISLTRTACAGIAGPTTRRPLPRCSARRRKP